MVFVSLDVLPYDDHDLLVDRALFLVGDLAQLCIKSLVYSDRKAFDSHIDTSCYDGSIISYFILLFKIFSHLVYTVPG